MKIELKTPDVSPKILRNLISGTIGSFDKKGSALFLVSNYVKDGKRHILWLNGNSSGLLEAVSQEKFVYVFIQTETLKVELKTEEAA